MASKFLATYNQLGFVFLLVFVVAVASLDTSYLLFNEYLDVKVSLLFVDDVTDGSESDATTNCTCTRASGPYSRYRYEFLRTNPDRFDLNHQD